VADAQAWGRLRDLVEVEALPADPPPLRAGGGDEQPAESVLAAAFATKPAGEWLAALRNAGVLAELVREVDRSGFTSGFVDDPVNDQFRRSVRYRWGDRGRVDQPTFPPRVGPEARPGAWPGVAGLGQHTAELLETVGFDADARIKLAASGVIAGALSD
jgi:crotonobetainyl-CoA:carnitine CoA-transferase CaiB-like acyl-CoA transferase